VTAYDLQEEKKRLRSPENAVTIGLMVEQLVDRDNNEKSIFLIHSVCSESSTLCNNEKC
jgi:hypothetical protein